MRKINRDYKLSVIACSIILFFYFFPYFYLQRESYITVLDNLDSDVVWFNSVAHSGKLFSFANNVSVENIMNGIPRNSLPPAFSVISIIFYFFSPFASLMVNYVLIHVVAFIGMFLLLKDFVFRDQKESAFLFGISLCFALLPFWGIVSGIAISGLPLVAWCFMKFYTGTHKYYHYLILLFFVFYSALIYTGIFVLILLFLVYLYALIFQKKYNIPFLLGIILMSSGYIIAELNLVIQFFSNDFISHRIEWKSEGDSFIQSMKNSVDIFLNGHYNAPSLNSPIITLMVISALMISFKKIKDQKNLPDIFHRLIIATFLLICAISLFYGIWNYKYFVALTGNIFIVKVITWSRFQWLTPFLWYILFALSIKVILSYKKNIIRKIALVFVGLQIMFLLFNNIEVRTNYIRIYSGLRNTNYLLGKNIDSYLIAPSFRQFYDEKMFNEIKEYIGQPQKEYRVLSLGIYPEILIHNGFYSLDSYQRNYDLRYKHQFRKIIKTELDKSGTQKNYFDNWGSRCYAFSSELPVTAWQLYGKDNPNVIKKLDFDKETLKQMGGKYLFSAVKIELLNNTWLNLKKVFEHKESFWKIYLYEIK